MTPRPIRFAQLAKVLKFFHNVELVKSPPAPTNSMYFIGSDRDEAFFPYCSGPVHYLDRAYEDSELIPIKLIYSLLKHLHIARDEFWKEVSTMATIHVRVPTRKK